MSRRTPATSRRTPTTLNEYKVTRNDWKVVKLNNIPKEDPLQSNFNNGGKAIKLSRKEGGRVYSEYYTLDSLAGMVGMYLRQKYSMPNSIKNIPDWVTPMIYFMDDDLIVFKHPFTRKNVRRRNVEFVIMKKKTNAKRATVQRSAAKKRKRS